MSETPHHPIIYIRGYAATQREIREAVASPYMGFNLGSTRVRQRWTGRIERLIFESPLVRLMKDHGYRDIYLEGAEIPPDHPMPRRSVIVYRYYEDAEGGPAAAGRQTIKRHAEGLSDLILSLRNRIAGDDAARRAAFRVYLVAHSMGGLICRCLLQNPEVGSDEAKRLVEKVFTYATPHNGIDLSVLGNIPGFFSRNNLNNFNRRVMARYLNLSAGPGGRVDDLGGGFDPERYFCLVGTNHRDYEPGAGLVAQLAGPMSDGLVRIANATVRGSPRAFVHRSHSGHIGIVNSEEGYQNLVRFLFGDVRIDGEMRFRRITLPRAIEQQKNAGRRIRASYHIETVVNVRGAEWDLHRRVMNEGSAIFRTYEELFERPEDRRRHPRLFSAYLSGEQRVNRRRASLGFAVELRVPVPQYEVDGALALGGYYRGGYLFHEKITLEATPPRADGQPWTLRYGFDSQTPNEARKRAQPGPSPPADDADAGATGRWVVPISQRSVPGLEAELHLVLRPWNGRQRDLSR